MKKLNILLQLDEESLLLSAIIFSRYTTKHRSLLLVDDSQTLLYFVAICMLIASNALSDKTIHLSSLASFFNVELGQFFTDQIHILSHLSFNLYFAEIDATPIESVCSTSILSLLSFSLFTPSLHFSPNRPRQTFQPILPLNDRPPTRQRGDLSFDIDYPRKMKDRKISTRRDSKREARKKTKPAKQDRREYNTDFGIFYSELYQAFTQPTITPTIFLKNRVCLYVIQKNVQRTNRHFSFGDVAPKNFSPKHTSQFLEESETDSVSSFSSASDFPSPSPLRFQHPQYLYDIVLPIDHFHPGLFSLSFPIYHSSLSEFMFHLI
ncbi:hypothetical protein BLNAU_13886 [Blattamonas nauphoetae]|uniref:Uncharacterized protein n=1 Tax=Blattamonas nauphoetae TaxID=2049346 RepID=A0ABQ9XFB0_9EUKA|nr:hypothetical protein BLNAU_13886 [Blattamonas nauphoetae]